MTVLQVLCSIRIETAPSAYAEDSAAGAQYLMKIKTATSALVSDGRLNRLDKLAF
ncbi:MAG: hypothetical protein GX924_01485 [Clostridiaceae bacterium]|jgi:hypothetical protein|nr:hypothetical protein [Clostridiaceae bacterium]